MVINMKNMAGTKSTLILFLTKSEAAYMIEAANLMVVQQKQTRTMNARAKAQIRIPIPFMISFVLSEPLYFEDVYNA